MTGPSLIGTCALLGFIWVVMVLVQTPVLALGLSRPHTWEVRLLAGGWLSACTVPLLMLVVPYLPEQGWSLAWGLVEFRTTVCQPQVAAGGCLAAVAQATLFYFAFDRDEPLASLHVTQDLAAVLVAFAAPIVLACCLIVN